MNGYLSTIWKIDELLQQSELHLLLPTFMHNHSRDKNLGSSHFSVSTRGKLTSYIRRYKMPLILPSFIHNHRRHRQLGAEAFLHFPVSTLLWEILINLFSWILAYHFMAVIGWMSVGRLKEVKMKCGERQAIRMGTFKGVKCFGIKSAKNLISRKRISTMGQKRHTFGNLLHKHFSALKTLNRLATRFVAQNFCFELIFSKKCTHFRWNIANNMDSVEWWFGLLMLTMPVTQCSGQSSMDLVRQLRQINTGAVLWPN